MRKKKMIMMKI